jgi:molecular chaperone DnaK
VFSTAADSQPSVEVHVMQGERPMAQDNRTLGKFNLDGIPPAPRGVPQIEVTFDIDANGIVNVQARDKGTGKEQKITITASSGLSKEEVDRMMRDAESHQADDKQRKEQVEARNRADQAVYAAEKFLRESGDKLEASDRMAIESAANDVKKGLESGDAKSIERTLDALMQAQQKAAERLYQQAGPSGPQGPGAGDAGPTGANGQADDIIDAEVVEEKK